MRTLALSTIALASVLLVAAVPKGVVPEAPFPASHPLLLPDGTPTTLAAQAGGKPLAVVVIKGTHCRVCLDELLRLARRADELAATGGKLVALSADAPAAHAKTIADLHLPFPILTDPDGVALKKLGFWMPRSDQPLPGVWWLDPCGKIVQRYEGRWPGRTQTEMILDGLRRTPRSRVCSADA
jgi:peroxiredoxin